MAQFVKGRMLIIVITALLLISVVRQVKSDIIK